MARLLLGIGLMLVLAGSALTLVMVVRSGQGLMREQVQRPDAEGATEQAISFWRSRTETDPTDQVAYAKLGLAYARYARESGDNAAYANAQDALQAALRLRPGDIEARAGLADAMLAQHRFDEALGLAQEVFEADPSATAALATMGDAHIALGNYEEGVAAYDRLADLATGPAVLSRLAYVAELFGQPDEAIELMREAEAEASVRSRSPERLAWYRTQLGDLLLKAGRLIEAQASYEQALDARPGHAFALGGLARVETAHGNYDRAVEQYEQALISREEPPFHAALGDLHRELGDEASAREHYGMARALSREEVENGIPHIHEFVMLHAGYGVETGRSVELALAQLKERRDIYAFDAAAWALYKDGRATEAAPLMEQALRLGTHDANLFFHAGTISQALGDEARARPLFQQAVWLGAQLSPRLLGEVGRALHDVSASADAG